MDALLDSGWMRELYSSSPMERFEWGRFSISTVASKATAARHFSRFRYRLYCFEPGSGKPAISVGIESDILGAWRLTVQTASGSRIAASFDEPPDYDAFKALALKAVDEASGTDTGAIISRRRRGKPRSPSP